jgi:hypothetical protein
MHEIVKCSKCGHEFDLNYGDKWAINDNSVVSQSDCKCFKKLQKQKPLDVAFKRLENEGIIRSIS